MLARTHTRTEIAIELGATLLGELRVERVDRDVDRASVRLELEDLTHYLHHHVISVVLFIQQRVRIASAPSSQHQYREHDKFEH